ncbi:MAG: hypothetical protein RTV31_12290 [Candidatus Thorarchaeota archaeon]
MRIVSWKLLAIIGLCCLLSYLPAIAGSNQLSASEGPTFSDYSDFYADFLNESASVWFHVTVTDSDGVDLVIGSTKEVSEHLWHNVTLIASESDPNRYYGHYPVILPSPGSLVFEVKYFAADSLDNWNVSDTVHHNLNNIGMSSPELDSVLVVTVSAIAVTAVVLIIGLFRIKSKK